MGVGGVRLDVWIVPGMSTFEKKENKEPSPNIVYECCQNEVLSII